MHVDSGNWLNVEGTAPDVPQARPLPGDVLDVNAAKLANPVVVKVVAGDERTAVLQSVCWYVYVPPRRAHGMARQPAGMPLVVVTELVVDTVPPYHVVVDAQLPVKVLLSLQLPGGVHVVARELPTYAGHLYDVHVVGDVEDSAELVVVAAVLLVTPQSTVVVQVSTNRVPFASAE